MARGISRLRAHSVIPGFGLTLGYTLIYLAVIVLIPLAALFLKAFEIGLGGIWTIATTPQVVAALKLSFGASFIAAVINGVFGLLLAWVLVRYEFPGKRVVDAIVDLPFALPTAVAGIVLATLYAKNGWIGALFGPETWVGGWFGPKGLLIAYTPLGVVVALTFVGLPFVVRTVQPVLEDFDAETEEAAASLGASRFATFSRVILPAILPSLVTGFTLAFARAVGEYGSVIFIAGNIPMVSEIAPLLIVTKLEEFNYAGAAAIAVVMLVISFALLLVINLLQRWNHARKQA
ncbi:sulfate ABC transporter permease subunit CysT [Zavarzinia compransoris]|uniref:Sulfate transport system permease protein CysT n=1 Tax=Zavarzinia compransoris TaxID=1264899 RepID=A0A317E096_9PROT|nr:sulfate ABC transporter permease subunit CysT [Zavarzinia compransoris]PWR20497.1 sulfate ABC transporter permease subunit CysT [Zavarzinia compransoris]TDP43857.1 sulfate transport system permease protein [Zavarzinia compransoris]